MGLVATGSLALPNLIDHIREAFLTKSQQYFFMQVILGLQLGIFMKESSILLREAVSRFTALQISDKLARSHERTTRHNPSFLSIGNVCVFRKIVDFLPEALDLLQGILESLLGLSALLIYL